MGANLELWTYRLFKNDTIYFEEVFQKTLSTTTETGYLLTTNISRASLTT